MFSNHCFVQTAQTERLQNFSVFDSISHAVDHQTAPVISDSYGLCETALSASEYSSLNGILAQAATQGQSVIAPSGDDGSTDCYGTSGLSTAQQQALAVDFPASSQYVTGMGGTEFPAADVDASNDVLGACQRQRRHQLSPLLHSRAGLERR
jgi:subtilase family serine protease